MWRLRMPLAVRDTPATTSNRLTVMTVTTWSLMITFILMFLSREMIKFSALRRFDVDDIAILIATIMGVGFFATSLVLISEGFGVLERLTSIRADILMKAYYASDFLYISSLCFAKLSLVAYFYNRFIGTTRRIVIGLGIFVVVWSIASLGAVAFQCKLPKPWEMMTLDCVNMGLFWMVYCILDMTTEVMIVMLSIDLAIHMEVSVSRKVVVIACFATRILVMAAALARLLYLYPITPHNDPHINLWIPVICAQVEICLAISTACIPYINPSGRVEGGAGGAHNIRKNGRSTAGAYRLVANIVGESAPRKCKMVHSTGPTVSVGPRYGRGSSVSPRIPTPPPLSPLSPPQYGVPAGSIMSYKKNVNASSGSGGSSEPGLDVHVPASATQAGMGHGANLSRVETAYSLELVPRHLIPSALHPVVRERNSLVEESTPLWRAQIPRLPLSSLYPGDSPASRSSTSIRSQPPSPNYSLFPKQVPHARYAFKPPDREPLIQKHRHGSQRNVSEPPSLSRATKSTTIPSPTLKSVRSVTTHSAGTFSTIPSYYLDKPLLQPPSPSQSRNRRILHPQNSSRSDPNSPATPTSPFTFCRDDNASEDSGANGAGRPSQSHRLGHAEGTPIAQDVRSPPEIVIGKAF